MMQTRSQPVLFFIKSFSGATGTSLEKKGSDFKADQRSPKTKGKLERSSNIVYCAMTGNK